MATTLDYYLPGVLSQDTRGRMKIYDELADYIQNPENSLYCDEMDKFIDGISSWIKSSNYKISLNGLDIISLLIDRIEDDFKTHIQSVLMPIVDRLGDNKEQVRENAQTALLKLMVPASSPQYIFDRIMSAFTHRLWRVREEVLFLLQKTLKHYGAKNLTLSKLVHSISKLLDDQSIPVREAAVNTLVEIYRHVGERVRHDVSKKEINPSKMKQIFDKMDEVKNSGEMLASAEAKSYDEPDFAKPVGVPKASKRQVSASSGYRRAGPSGKIMTSSASHVSSKRKRTPLPTGSAGAVDEDFFIRSFEDVRKTHLFSSKELHEHMTKIKECLAEPKTDWEKRVELLKELRSLLIAGATEYDDFLQLLRVMEPAFQLSAKDLRSQVVRETCITIAYLSQQLGNKFDHFAESILPHLINLIPNSAKIMSASGVVSIRFIIQHTHAPRLIPIITSNLSSKASVIRRDCIVFLDQLLHTWPTHCLERHIANIQEAIKRGLTDADSEARAHSRKAFWGFADHFKEQADSLMNALEPSKQKMLQGELSTSSSNNSLSGSGQSRLTAPHKVRARSMSTDRTTVYGRVMAGPSRRSAMAKTHSPMSDTTDTSSVNDEVDNAVGGGAMRRSNSAVDLPGTMSVGRTPAAARFTQRTSYNSLRKTQSTVDLANDDSKGSRLPRPRWGASPTTPSHLPQPRKRTTSNNHTPLTQNLTSPPDRSRPRSKIGFSQSQPGSRSTSPSSRHSYLTHIPMGSATSGRSRTKSGIPRSQGASRDSSPSRYGRERKLSGQGNRQLMAQRIPQSRGGILAHRCLVQGSDMEQAVADALGGPQRTVYDGYESDDAGSETSSVCSERSYSSYGRASEASDLGERRPSLRMTKDISEMFQNLSSASWADRKEGLQVLQNLLRSNRCLNRIELRKVTEIFTRMFHDPHGKVLSIFLETLVDLLAVHKQDLHEWVHICLTRLINKMGADMLASVRAKLQHALEAVRDSFPYNIQFNTLTRFIVDQSHMPNLKAEVALLNYIHGLALSMDASDFVNTSDTRLAVSRIIAWTTEPKSVDVRKSAQAVLIALFNLNTPEFSIMLQLLPRTFQDSARKILQNHLQMSNQEPLSPRNVTSPTGHGNRYRASPARSNIDDVDTENMNPEEIYNSIKKASADIQNLSKIDSSYYDIKKEKDTISLDSGIQGSNHDVRGSSPDMKDSPRSSKKPQYNPSFYQDDNLEDYDKTALAEAVFDVENEWFNQTPWKTLLGLANNKNALPLDGSDVVTEILKELSNHNRRHDERKNAMLHLIKMTRDNSNVEVWEEHFNSILLILLETLGDDDKSQPRILNSEIGSLITNLTIQNHFISGHIRALSLRVLREIVRHQPARFSNCLELTIMKILDAHKDPVREVTRAAEDCANTLANYLPADQLIRVLSPIVCSAQFPINLAAIKMETDVIEASNKDSINGLVPDMMRGLFKSYNSYESSVRKACVFCLVALYMVVGEELRPFLKDLRGSQLKLLNVYIQRAVAQRDEAAQAKASARP